ncbi:MAG: hypothetical protein Q9199_003934, partial [Rusavskia elegans]
MQDDFKTILYNDESFSDLNLTQASPLTVWEQETRARYPAYGDCEVDLFTSTAELPWNKMHDYNCALLLGDTKLGNRREYIENTQHGKSADDESLVGILKPGQRDLATGIRLKGPEEVRDWVNEDCEYTAPVPQLSYTQQDVNRWMMAGRACATFVRDDLPTDTTENVAPFVRRCGDFRFIEVSKASVAVGFGAVAMIYGGIHAFAWLAYFRSTTEQLLWRVSTCIVTGGIPVMYAIVTITDWHYELKSSLERSDMVGEVCGLVGRFVTIADLRRRRGDKGFIILVLGSILFWTVVLLYVLARVYLIGECFIQLTHMPADVYK